MHVLDFDQWSRFEAECDRLGLGHRVVGALDASSDLRKLLGVEHPVDSGANGVVLLAQAGGRYWEVLQSLRTADPELDGHRDPLDTLTRRVAKRLENLLGEGYGGAIFPFNSNVDFVRLGEALGAGKRSRLQILIHPRYGPWFAFRMAILLRAPDSFFAPGASIQNPCDDCPAPCIAACPAAAFEGAPGNQRLNYAASFEYRLQNVGVCQNACAARLACPVGNEFRYPSDFIQAAHHRAFEVGAAYFKKPQGGTEPVQGRLL